MEARIVVVNNDERTRALLTATLQSQEWQVFSYAYTQIDLPVLEQHHPNLVILDFNHQDGAIGWPLLQLLKMDDTTAHIPILITTTGFDWSVDERSYLLIRDITIFRSPFDLDTFMAFVQKTLLLASQAGALFSSDRRLPILVVDDTESIRDNIVTLLDLEGYSVVTASNGLEALEAISRADYCLILLDIAMPIMNGFEFLSAYDRQLRPHTPVIILSGEQDIREHILPAFVVDVQPRPFDFKRLLSMVGKYAPPIRG